jgi:hypothetical protein
VDERSSWQQASETGEGEGRRLRRAQVSISDPPNVAVFLWKAAIDWRQLDLMTGQRATARPTTSDEQGQCSLQGQPTSNKQRTRTKSMYHVVEHHGELSV